MATTTSLPAIVEMGTVMLAEVAPGSLLAVLTNVIAARAGAETSAEAISAETTADGVRFIRPPVPGRCATFGEKAALTRKGGRPIEARVDGSGRQAWACRSAASGVIPMLLNGEGAAAHRPQGVFPDRAPGRRRSIGPAVSRRSQLGTRSYRRKLARVTTDQTALGSWPSCREWLATV